MKTLHITFIKQYQTFIIYTDINMWRWHQNEGANIRQKALPYAGINIRLSFIGVWMNSPCPTLILRTNTHTHMHTHVPDPIQLKINSFYYCLQIQKYDSWILNSRFNFAQKSYSLTAINKSVIIS